MLLAYICTSNNLSGFTFALMFICYSYRIADKGIKSKGNSSKESELKGASQSPPKYLLKEVLVLRTRMKRAYLYYFIISAKALAVANIVEFRHFSP